METLGFKLDSKDECFMTFKKQKPHPQIMNIVYTNALRISKLIVSVMDGSTA